MSALDREERLDDARPPWLLSDCGSASNAAASRPTPIRATASPWSRSGPISWSGRTDLPIAGGRERSQRRRGAACTGSTAWIPRSPSPTASFSGTKNSQGIPSVSVRHGVHVVILLDECLSPHVAMPQRDHLRLDWREPYPALERHARWPGPAGAVPRSTNYARAAVERPSGEPFSWTAAIRSKRRFSGRNR